MASPFDSFTDEQRWVEWRNTPRQQGGRTVLAKLPRGKGGRPAKADDPTTWLTRPQAEDLFRSTNFPPLRGGGIGLELGQIGPDIAIGGVDLDTCFEPDGQVADWASAVIHRFKSYAEISPSETGIKIFFYYQPSPELAQLLGSQDGRSFKRPTGADHPPAIELFLARRYFAVTEKPSHRAYREIRLVDFADLEWLITHCGPNFAGTAAPTQKGTDNSRSAAAFRLAQSLRSQYPSIGFDRFCELLRDNPSPEIASWLSDKGDDRQLQRLYQRAAPGDDNWDDDIARRVTEYQDSEFTRQADGRWLDQWGNELSSSDDGALAVTRPPNYRSWGTHTLARWIDQPIPAREWFLDGWIPRGQVVGLYGKPGSRKSTLLLQLMIAAVLGQPFYSTPLLKGPCYGLFCEDSEAEIARRALAVLNHYNASFADMADCHAESLVHARTTAFTTFSRNGNMIAAGPAWDTFLEDINLIKPVFVCLDVIADFFTGSEINRNHVSQFLALLDRTAAQYNFALVFSAHPSLRGINDKSLSSGSTGWEGKARGRITLADPTDCDDNPTANTSQRRTLTLAKANYAPTGAEMNLRLENHCFVPEYPTQTPSFEIAASLAKAERVFLNLLRLTNSAGRYVSPNTRGNFAPRIFSHHPANEGCSQSQLARAMENLLYRNTIALTTPLNRYPPHLFITAEPWSQPKISRRKSQEE